MAALDPEGVESYSPGLAKRRGAPPSEPRGFEPSTVRPEGAARRFRKRNAVLATLLCGLAAAGVALAERPEPPPYYAIRDAKVYVAPGNVLERATVLIEDGLVAAVGADLDIPADVWTIDGRNLVVFPGLIDAMSGLAGEADGEEAAGRPGAGGPPMPGRQEPVRGPLDRPQTTPWERAADALDPDDPRLAKWRLAGFTTALVAPEEGLFAGQAALVNLGGEAPRDMVVAAPVGQRLNFAGEGSFRRFPGSPMGGYTYLRQTFADARHQATALARYDAAPRGKTRPDYDPALEPIREAMAAGRPFLMPADRGPAIDRALALAAEFDLRPILYGGQGAYERVAELADAEVPVIVDLEWPEAEKDRDPDADTPFHELAYRRLARATPARLAAAGVPFAFASRELPSPAKVFAGVREAMDAGLSGEDAMAALTLDAARVLGVDDRLGTLERGKIANLVLATAEPWVEDVEIRTVFIDGRPYREREEEAAPREPPAGDVSGTWKLQLQTPGGAREMTAELEMKPDGKVTGELRTTRGTRTVEKGRLSGELLTFKTTQTMGGRTFEASYSLTLAGEELAGTLSAGPMTMDLAGERTASPEPEAEDGDEPAVPLEEIERALAVYRGPVREMGSYAITNARVYTVSGETWDDATVVVRGGKIVAVGADVAVPAGAEAIDATGGSLVPGIIDAHSHIATDGGVNEGTLAVTSMVSIRDFLDPYDVAIYRALAGGVTTINVLHGSSNPIGGQNAVLKLRWGRDGEAMLFDAAPPGIKFALGENPKRSNFRNPLVPDRYPTTRMGVIDVIRQAFLEAEQYRDELDAHRRAGGDAIPPRRDLALEPLVEILEGERLVHAHSYRADEILQLLRLAEEFGFKIATFQHVLEGYKVADELAAHGAGASTFSDWWGYKVEAYDAIPHNAAIMTERGVVVSINSDSGEEMRHLNQEAAKTVKWGGLDEVEALKLVTLNPAIQLGIDHRVGSIEVGKDADLVLYDGPPLSVFSVVQKTFVDGDLYFDLDADRERQAEIEAIKRRLEGKDEPGEDASGEAEPDEGEPDEGEPDGGESGEAERGEGEPGEGEPDEEDPGEEPAEPSPAEPSAAVAAPGRPGQASPAAGKPARRAAPRAAAKDRNVDVAASTDRLEEVP